jgi:N-acetyltransferase 10
MLDYHVIIDMIPTIAELYFRGEMPKDIKLSGVQSAILLGVGLQRKSIDNLQKELNLASNQVLALFVKLIRKMSQHFAQVETQAYQEPAKKKVSSGERDANDDEAWKPLKENLDDDLEKAGDEAIEGLKAKQRELIDSLDLTKYAIGGKDEDWTSAEGRVKGMASGKVSSSVVSVKNENSSKKRKLESAKSMAEKEKNKQTSKVKLSKKAKRS